MHVLITGANGFAASYIIEQLLLKSIPVLATGRGPDAAQYDHELYRYELLDFTNPSQVNKIIQRYKPTHIIHAGAISKPDICEQQQSEAEKINLNGTKYLLEAAASQSCNFLFLSTDFVFDGIQGMYKETDIPAPVNFYGSTKLRAEHLVQQYTANWSIARTVLLYGHPRTGRDNILTIAQNHAEAGKTYRVVNDQVRTPTYVGDLAAGIVRMIETDAAGIFHLSGKDIKTPYEMCIDAARLMNWDVNLIVPVSTSELAQPALRPMKTGFDIHKARTFLGFEPLSFEQGLHKTFL